MPAEDPAAPDQFKDSSKTASDVMNNSKVNQSGGPKRAPESSLEKSFNDAISDDLIGQLSEELEEMALDLRSGATLAQIAPAPNATKMLSQQIFQAADRLQGSPAPPRLSSPASTTPTPYISQPPKSGNLSADAIDDSEFGFDEAVASTPDSNRLNSLLSKAFVPRPAAKVPAEMTGAPATPDNPQESPDFAQAAPAPLKHLPVEQYNEAPTGVFKAYIDPETPAVAPPKAAAPAPIDPARIGQPGVWQTPQPPPTGWQSPPQSRDDNWSVPSIHVQPIAPGAAFGRTRKDPYGKDGKEERNNSDVPKVGKPATLNQPPVPGDEPIILPTFASSKYKDPAPNTVPPATQQQAHTGLSAVPQNRGYRNQLHEDTAMVMPHVAPQPEPDQNVSEQFAKSVPGMSPMTEPGRQMLTPPSNRRAKDRLPEVVDEKLLPARIERKQQAEADRRPVEQPRREAPRPSRSAPKPVSNSGGFHNLRGRDGEPPLQFLRQNWRLCVMAVIAMMMLISVGSLISIGTKSLSALGMSASQKAGKEAYKDRMFDEAVRFFNEAIQKDPSNADLYRDRASAHLALQEYSQAVNDCSNVIKLKGDLAAAHLDRAAAYFYLGRYDKAVDDYDELIKLRPNDADAYFGRGLANFKIRHYPDALADYEKVVSLKPDKDQVYEYMGNVQVERGDFKAAVKSYSEALRINSRDANAFYMRGVAQSKLQQYQEAARDLSSAIGVQPGRIEFWNDRGFTFLQQGRYKDAIEDFATALELNPQFAMARQNRTSACDKFVDSLKNQLQHNAKDTRALANLAFCYDNLEDYALAIDSANKALAIDDKNVNALINRANAELQQKRYNVALADADKAIQASPNDVNAYLTRARVYLRLNQFANAVEDYTKCLQDERKPLYALRERALAHLLASDGSYASIDAKEFLKSNGWGNALSGSAALICWLSLRQLQDIDGANAILNEAQTHLRPGQWPYPIFKYLKRDITLAQLSEMTNNDRELTDVKLWSAFNLLLNGKKQDAAQAFGWVRHNGFQGDDALLAQNR